MHDDAQTDGADPGRDAAQGAADPGGLCDDGSDVEGCRCRGEGADAGEQRRQDEQVGEHDGGGQRSEHQATRAASQQLAAATAVLVHLPGERAPGGAAPVLGGQLRVVEHRDAGSAQLPQHLVLLCAQQGLVEGAQHRPADGEVAEREDPLVGPRDLARAVPAPHRSAAEDGREHSALRDLEGRAACGGRVRAAEDAGVGVGLCQSCEAVEKARRQGRVVVQEQHEVTGQAAQAEVCAAPPACRHRRANLKLGPNSATTSATIGSRSATTTTSRRLIPVWARNALQAVAELARPSRGRDDDADREWARRVVDRHRPRLS